MAALTTANNCSLNVNLFCPSRCCCVTVTHGWRVLRRQRQKRAAVIQLPSEPVRISWISVKFQTDTFKRVDALKLAQRSLKCQESLTRHLRFITNSGLILAKWTRAVS